MCILHFAAAIGGAQDYITEDDVLRAMDGKPHPPTPGQPLGIALHVTFTLQMGSVPQDELAFGGPNLNMDGALYKSLIPMARALASEVFSETRFVIRVAPSTPVSVEHADKVGRELADKVQHFLTTYFTIPRHRLSFEVPLTSSATEGLGGPRQGTQRWRLEILRQE